MIFPTHFTSVTSNISDKKKKNMGKRPTTSLNTVAELLTKTRTKTIQTFC